MGASGEWNTDSTRGATHAHPLPARARLTLGGVAPVPWQAAAAEELLAGQLASDTLFARAAEAALADAEPLEHNAYKLPLAGALIRRALQSLIYGASKEGAKQEGP